MSGYINPDLLIGASSHTLQHINDRLFDISDKMDYGSKIIQAPMCYGSLLQNPDLNKINKPGIYPLYSYNALMQNGSVRNVTWGSCIVIPYSYGVNNQVGHDWLTQLIIGAGDWNDAPPLMILGRTCSYYGGWGKWTSII